MTFFPVLLYLLTTPVRQLERTAACGAGCFPFAIFAAAKTTAVAASTPHNAPIGFPKKTAL